MKFRLKSIFLLTLFVAMLLGCALVNVRILARASELEATVETSLDQLSDTQALPITRGQYQNDFGLFSSGIACWDIRVGDGSDARIELKWRSRLWFAEGPTVEVSEDGHRCGKRFTKAFIEAFQATEKAVTVNEFER
ncbi:MAG: hypothetical protein VXZ82_18805 [Planctomycetota bacterium]|nr:hypothetical protein [Planctomycetota bacterium]